LQTKNGNNCNTCQQKLAARRQMQSAVTDPERPLLLDLPQRPLSKPEQPLF